MDECLREQEVGPTSKLAAFLGGGEEDSEEEVVISLTPMAEPQLPPIRESFWSPLLWP